MLRCLVFVLTMCVSSAAWAQTPSRFSSSATKRAVSAAAAKTPMSRHNRILTGTIIGAGAGMLAGYLYWQAIHDCDICEPGPAGSMALFGLIGAGIGGSIGAMGRSSPDRHRGIPIGRRITADPVVSPTRVGARVTIAF